MLGVDTPEGQRLLGEERKAVSLFLRHFPALGWIDTPKQHPVTVDGFLYLSRKQQAQHLSAVVEVKTRRASVEEQCERYGPHLMITAEKLIRGAEISRLCYAPFVLMLWFVEDCTLFVWKMTDRRGRFLVPFEARPMNVRESLTGGRTERFCAFLPLSAAKQYNEPNNKND